MKKDELKYTAALALLMGYTCLDAQKDAHEIYNGNNEYFTGRVLESSSKYSRALEINPNNRKANFNLGDALYRNAQLIASGKMGMPAGSNMTPDSLAKLVLDKAAENFAVVANSVSNKDTLHRAWHNIGNCFLMKKDFEQAITAYKKALKFNPKDEETRYNLAYALKNRPKNNNGGGGNNQQQKQQQNKNQENKDQKKSAQQSEPKMSKEQAEQLLKAMMDAERKLQEKRKQKAENTNNQVEKDW